MHFLDWKCMNFYLNFAEVCSYGSINNIPAVVQIMALRLPGDKPWSEPMMVRLPTHICITWPQWVNYMYFPSKLHHFKIFRPEQNACFVADNICKSFFLKKNCSTLTKISLKIVIEDSIDNKSDLFRWWFGTAQVKSHYLNQWCKTVHQCNKTEKSNESIGLT